jgi:hypothetical protein
MSLKFSEFISKFPHNTKFVKLLNNEKKHYDFQYKIGLNEDTIQFNPKGTCLPGGLYFTTYEHIEKFIGLGMNRATIQLCEDALFYCDPEGFKWKTNKFIITKIEQTCKLAVQQCGYALKYVKKQTEDICKLAIKTHSCALIYVKEQTEKLYKSAVKQNGLALRYVKKQMEEICKLAVQQNSDALICKAPPTTLCYMSIPQMF